MKPIIKPIRFAFFDADETLLAMKSMFDFLEFFLIEQNPSSGPTRFATILSDFQKRTQSGVSRNVLNEDYYRLFKNVANDSLEQTSRQWFQSRWSKHPNRFVPEGLMTLELLRGEGYQPVIVSGSFLHILRPFAEELRIGPVLCGEPILKEGKLTGELSRGPMIGENKAKAVREMMAHLGADPDDCVACGDSYSDIPMLEAVGQAIAIRPDAELLKYAKNKHWLIR